MKATVELKSAAGVRTQALMHTILKKLKPGDKEYEKIKNSITEFGFADPRSMPT